MLVCDLHKYFLKMYTNYHRILLSVFGCQVWPVGYLQGQKTYFFFSYEAKIESHGIYAMDPPKRD